MEFAPMFWVAASDARSLGRSQFYPRERRFREKQKPLSSHSHKTQIDAFNKTKKQNEQPRTMQTIMWSETTNNGVTAPTMQNPKNRHTTRQLSCFPFKVHCMLEDVEMFGLGDIVSWLPHGKSFRVHNEKGFVDTIMKSYFQQSKFTSFTRQLYIYGFQKVQDGPDRGAFVNELFVRHDKSLCLAMKRKPDKPLRKRTCKKQIPAAASSVNTSTSSSIPVPLTSDGPTNDLYDELLSGLLPLPSNSNDDVLDLSLFNTVLLNTNPDCLFDNNEFTNNDNLTKLAPPATQNKKEPSHGRRPLGLEANQKDNIDYVVQSNQFISCRIQKLSTDLELEGQFASDNAVCTMLSRANSDILESIKRNGFMAQKQQQFQQGEENTTAIQ